MSENTQYMIDLVVKYRGLPKIEKGQRCEVDGKPGEIVGGNSAANLNVLFDDNPVVMNCHPNYRMKIFNKSGGIIHRSDD